MKVIAPLHIGNLGKAFFIVLLALTVTWMAISYLVFQEIYVVRPILVANLILAVVLGWFYYRYRYHMAFSYDQEGFQIRCGQLAAVWHRWEEFKRLSLVHLGAGRLGIRLYLKEVPESEEGEPEFMEIPATDLQLDAFALREEITPYVLGPGREKSSSA